MNYYVNRLSLFVMSVSVGLLVGCSGDNSSGEQQAVLIDATIPSYMEEGSTVTVPISLSYATSLSIAASSDDIRTVTISDISNCDPKLIITPSQLNITVGAEATSFELTAPGIFCEHTVQINVTGSTSSTTSDPVTVLESVVEVGLYTPSGYRTNSVSQGSDIVIHFTAPLTWGGVSDIQSYSVSTDATGVTFTNNPCEFIPGVTSTCDVTADVATSVNTGRYTFSITNEPGTVVNTDFDSLSYNVTTPSYAFVSNWKTGVNSVSRCKVDTAGFFTDCADTGGINFYKPYGITLNAAGNLAFIVNYARNASAVYAITVCNVDSLGAFSGCTSSGDIGLSKPANMTLNAYGDKAFIANNLSNKVRKCDVSNTGVFTNCIDVSNIDFGVPNSVLLNSAEDLAFITNSSTDLSDPKANTVSRCSVDEFGFFSNCSSTTSTIEFDTPSGITLNASETLAFITNIGSDTVSRCNIDIATGLFSNCLNTGGTGFDSPSGIILNDSETLAFITNKDSTTVSRCVVDIEGAFTDCKNTEGTGFYQPAGVALSNRIKYSTLPNYPDSVNPPTTTTVTGIRGVAAHPESVYITGILNSGGTETFGFIYEGPINMSDNGGWSALSFPDSGGEIVSGTAFYGPNNGTALNTVNIVGNYTNSGSTNALGLLYQGSTDGAGTWRTLTPTYPGETTLNTIAHSNMGDLVVGNFDTNLSTGRAFIYNMNTNTYYNLEKQDAISITAYGIWDNENGTYTIAGGYSDAGDPNGNGLDHGYLVDWDSLTNQAYNWKDYNYKNLPTSVLISHFEGITSDGAGGYNLATDSALSSAPDNFVLASFAHVIRNGDGTFGDADWIDLSYPHSAIMSANTVYLQNILGIYIAIGKPSRSYLATLPE